MNALVLTPWVWDVDGYAPLFQEIFIAGSFWWTGARDITYQPAANIPPSPNISLWEIADVSQAALDALTAEGRCLVLWAGDPAATVLNTTKTAAQDYLGSLGLTLKQARAIVGTPSTMRELATNLGLWAKGLTR
ncbi:MAG: hypothetical protein ACYCYF_07100 [Anaerolineae bacterium]